MLVALAVFALSPNRDPRYVAPLLPLVAVVVSWAIVQGGLDWAAHVVMGALSLQLAAVQDPGPGPLADASGSLAVRAWHRSGARAWSTGTAGPAADLAAIVQRTCGRGGFGADNFVGVDLLTSAGTR